MLNKPFVSYDGGHLSSRFVLVGDGNPLTENTTSVIVENDVEFNKCNKKNKGTDIAKNEIKVKFDFKEEIKELTDFRNLSERIDIISKRQVEIIEITKEMYEWNKRIELKLDFILKNQGV